MTAEPSRDWINGDQLTQILDGLERSSDVDLRGARITTGRVHPTQHLGHLNLEKAELIEFDKLGPIVAKRLNLDGARFDRHVEIEVNAEQVTCVGTRFDGGVTLRVSTGTIDATGAVFGSTSSITISLAFGGRSSFRPKLVSLRGVDVSNLVLVDVDLTWCLFVGAHRLDQLRLEDQCRFGGPPESKRWSRRQVLAEECLSRGWTDKHPLSDALPIRWERLAALYRALRKAFEDSKNEAGAGDFYYGEMEMRRRSATTRRAERLILWAYWLLSGYGQRAGRAVAALGVLVAIVCILLFTVGLPGGVDWHWARIDQSLRIGMGAVVFREAGQTLTSAGGWTVMVARFAGPVLLALALLAVRARVKR